MSAPVRKSWFTLLAFVIGSQTSLALAQADDCAEDLIYPPDERVHGKTAGEWSASFVEWLLSIPKSSSPDNDPSGERCALEQEGPVFFLPGRGFLSGPLVLKDCTVPCGRDILIPLNATYAWSPGDCDPGHIDVCRGLLREIVDTIDGLRLIVDGRSVGCLEDHRTVSPEFLLTVPPDNIIDLPRPLERTFVVDGYHVILRASALAPGKHTITWNTTRTNGEVFPDLTYELTVGPCEAATFHRGDSSSDTHVNVTDAIVILNRLFLGGEAFRCDDAADSNDDGRTDVTDAVYLLEYLFRRGPLPPAPGFADCGTDPTEDSLDCGKGC